MDKPEKQKIDDCIGTLKNERGICRYRYCVQGLSFELNGNRKYCSDECSYFERLERQKQKGLERKNILAEISRAEGLLRACYKKFNESPFDIQILRGMKMNWTIFSDTLVIDSISYRIVGSFGYTAYANYTIKIVKI